MAKLDDKKSMSFLSDGIIYDQHGKPTYIPDDRTRRDVSYFTYEISQDLRALKNTRNFNNIFKRLLRIAALTKELIFVLNGYQPDNLPDIIMRGDTFIIDNFEFSDIQSGDLDGVDFCIDEEPEGTSDLN